MKNYFINRLSLPKGYKATHVLQSESIDSDRVYVGFRVDEQTGIVLDAKWWLADDYVDVDVLQKISYDVIGMSHSEAEACFLSLLSV